MLAELLDFLAANDHGTVSVQEIAPDGNRIQRQRFHGESEDEFLEAYGPGNYIVKVYKPKGEGRGAIFESDLIRIKGAAPVPQAQGSNPQEPSTFTKAAQAIAEIMTVSNQVGELTTALAGPLLAEKDARIAQLIADRDARLEELRRDKDEQIEALLEQIEDLRRERDEAQAERDEAQENPVAKAINGFTAKIIEEQGPGFLEQGRELFKQGLRRVQGERAEGQPDPFSLEEVG